MSKQLLARAMEAFLRDDVEAATAFAKQCIQSKTKCLVNEDHDKSMDSEQLAHYLRSLHAKASMKQHAMFASHMGQPDCSDKSFDLCADELSKDKHKADEVIHKLETLVGSKIDPKEYKKDKQEGESDDEAEVESQE